jgi:hypothetical protein
MLWKNECRPNLTVVHADSCASSYFSLSDMSSLTSIVFSMGVGISFTITLSV